MDLLLRFRKKWLVGLGLLLSSLVGCTSTRWADKRLQVETGYCDPPQAYTYNLAYRPLANVQSVVDSALLKAYPRRSLLLANAAGVLPQLKALVHLEQEAKQHPAAATTLAVLAQRQQVLAHLQLMAAAVASIAAELDCEGERADQIAGYLTEQENQRVQRLTVLSIAAGAASGIGTTVFSAKATQYAFGVGGGLLTAGLGLLTLSSHRKITFTHPRNLLTDVWQESPTSQVYPPNVWYVLQEKAFSNLGESSVGHNTHQRWRRYGQLAAPDSPAGRRQQTLFFGTGGAYSADELRIRSNMLNELQSAVRLINQDLQGLLLEITHGQG
jgi:hypothetical protein